MISNDEFSVEKITSQIIKIGKYMGDKGYTPGYSGNISARIDDKILITTSGVSNAHLKDSDLTLMNFEGESLCPEKKPSSEKNLHIQFYKMRSDINYILHVHSPFLSAFASANRDLLSPIMAENVYYFKGIPLAEYALPSTDALVENTAKYFLDYDAVLMANHGFIIGSASLKDAYLKLELAEHYAQVVINTEILGGAKVLSSAQANEILNLR